MAIDTSEAIVEIRRLSTLLDQGLDAMRTFARQYADAEATYRRAKAEAWLIAPREHEDGAKITAGEREAWVNAHTAEERKTRDYADAMRQAALEAVRSRRGQLSAIQTICNVEREELAFARTAVSA